MRKSSKKSSINPSKPDNRSNYCLTGRNTFINWLTSILLDFFNNYDEVTPKIRTVENVFSNEQEQMVSSIVYYSNFRCWLYCIICSCLTALACFLIEFLANWIYLRLFSNISIFLLILERKKNLIEEQYYSSLLVWIISSLILGTIATGLCHVFGAEAQGAG